MIHGGISCFQDCTLYHHVFKDAKRPASEANPQGIALNIKGDIAYACKEAHNFATAVKPLANIMR